MKDILDKANYCLNCKTKPCQLGCPMGNDIPAFIQCVKNQNFEEAYKILSKTTVLQSVCGRVCPHSSQCQGNCIRGIKGDSTEIGKLEAFVGDKALEEGYLFDDNGIEKNGKKVAVVGGGPAGLTCSAFLARKGYEVTIFEKQAKLGGILEFGIPEFRLDKEVLEKSIRKIIDLGVNVELEKELGKDFTIRELEEKFDAVFISIGANVPLKMNIPGEEIEGVYGANSLLENNSHPDYKDKKVAVIGGGNVAMDAARVVKKLGAKDVFVIYRRSQEEMPAEEKEIKEAQKEGIEFLFQNNIISILANKAGKVNKIELVKTELIQKEGETRLFPVDIDGSNYIINMDYVIMAVGSKVQDITKKINLDINSKGYIVIDDKCRTSNSKIFAGGDVTGNKQTVAWAAKTGRIAADSIDEMLKT